jgi:hypothetical protein
MYVTLAEVFDSVRPSSCASLITQSGKTTSDSHSFINKGATQPGRSGNPT